ncbi:MAG: glycine zipper 2TM domain-containing protein [Desulfobacterales bacterium]|nr:glycine zipper 2TM domain-containing protein [Desulfobacterales bacterium]
MIRPGTKLNMVFVLLCAVIIVSGCSPSRSGNVYTSDQAMRAHTIVEGTVESVKLVTIEAGEKPVAGTVIGGVAGGVLGSTIGSGSGSKVGAVVGSLAGAAAGAAAEKNMGTRQGIEIVVDQDNGQKIVVVQEADVQLSPGDRVRVLTSPDGTVRVSK